MVSKVFVPESNSLTEEAQKELAELGEETDDYVVATKAKKQQIIKDYTAVPSNNGKGVDILDENGNYRNTYSILKDISEIYSEIQKQDKAMGTNLSLIHISLDLNNKEENKAAG